MPQGTFGFAAQGQPDEIERGGSSLCCNPKWPNKARTLSKPTVALLMLHLSAAGMSFPGQRVDLFRLLSIQPNGKRENRLVAAWPLLMIMGMHL